MQGGPEVTDEDIRAALMNPIGTSRLYDLAKDRQNVVIIVDDLSRPTPVFRIMPFVIAELAQAGITRDQITVLMALGAHRPMTREEMVLKLGEDVVDTINIENHHPFINLSNLGASSYGTPIHINTTYVESDLKISIGGVIPHMAAGFGGGAKLVLPGVAGIETLAANHGPARKGKGLGIGVVTPLREEIEEVVGKVGLDFTINVLLNEYGGPTGITAGHFIKAHRAAMELGRQIYRTAIPKGHDILFLNAFPEDIDVNQSKKGFNLMMSGPEGMLDKTRSIVFMSASYEGRGFHSLTAETGSKLRLKLEDTPLWTKFIGDRNFFYYSPNISENDLHHIYPKSVKLFRKWTDLIEVLSKYHGNSPKVALFTCSIQMLASE
jgi:nickel-dependent lactate racemase